MGVEWEYGVTGGLHFLVMAGCTLVSVHADLCFLGW